MTTRLVGLSGAAAGIDMPLEQDVVGIGRQSDNAICIPETSVSRHHCVIHCRHSEWSIADLGSANGTFVNDEVLRGERGLVHGDRVRIGGSVLHFLINEACGSEVGAFTIDDWAARPTVVMSRQDIDRSQNAFFRGQYPGDRANRSLGAFLGIGDLLVSGIDPAHMQQRLLSLIADVVPADRGAILLATKDGSDPEVSCIWSRTGTADSFPVSRSIITRVFQEGAALLAAGPALEEISRSGILFAARVTSLICVPLLMHTIRDRVAGAIYLDTPDPTKQFDEEHLRVLSAIAGYAAVAVYNARRMQQLENENKRLRSKEQIHTTMIGDSAVLGQFCDRLHRVAATDATVLIIGESGTGKELAARALHLNSPRATKPFEAVNCALLQNTLLESELFGHEKGAFTGAVTQKRGRLELADGGTVFLDELGELPESPQAMLLRVLQEREFLRVGGTRPIHVDVRLIAATNKNLEQAVKDKRFREDLFYRLNVICLRVPPLRDHREDIPLLAHHFLRRASTRNKRMVSDVSPEAMRLMMTYYWPGNVRELENAIEYAVVFALTDEILPEDLPETLHVAVARENPAVVSNYQNEVRKAREKIVLTALHQSGYKFGEAAKLLGINVSNLHRLIRELNLKEQIKRRES